MTHLHAEQWLQIISVFVAAFLGMCTGIVVELFKNWRAKVKTSQETTKYELQQLNRVIASIAFNIETVLHLVIENMLPHYQQSHAAYNALCALPQDSESIGRFAASLPQYPALMMTCPELHLIECDFWKEIPFIIEQNAELLKQSGWLVSYAREVKNATSNRNKQIEAALAFTNQRGGALNFHVLYSILQLQASIADSECVTTFEFFRVCLRMARYLETINRTYNVAGVNKARLSEIRPLPDALRELKKIADKLVTQKPTYSRMANP